MTVPHPIPYQGSKRKLANAIVSLFPNDTNRLIEPFAGSAAVSLLAAHRNKAKHFILNDINQALIELWSEIINRPEEIVSLYRKLWEEQKGREKEFYNLIRDKFNKNQKPKYFLYLLARCVKASVRYNSLGEFNQSPDNRRSGMHPNVLKKNVLKASQYFKNRTSLFSKDYAELLKAAEPKDVVYMDPPYQGVSEKRNPRYITGLSFDSFVGILDELNKRKISYIVSYDGRTGKKVFGQRLPNSLKLEHVEIEAGRSSQATLLGKNHKTYESLYLSPALLSRISFDRNHVLMPEQKELLLGVG